MSFNPRQLDLFENRSLNPAYEVKRQIRLALSGCGMSRGQVVDRMNAVIQKEGGMKQVSQATLDSWTKSGDLTRLPGPAHLTVLCAALKNTAPLAVLAAPLGAAVIGPDQVKILKWGQAELERRAAAKKSRRLLEEIDDD